MAWTSASMFGKYNILIAQANEHVMTCLVHCLWCVETDCITALQTCCSWRSSRENLHNYDMLKGGLTCNPKALGKLAVVQLAKSRCRKLRQTLGLSYLSS